MNPVVPLLLLAFWQAAFLVGIFRRHWWLGLTGLGYSIIWVVLLLWAGALEPGVVAFLVAFEVAAMVAVYWSAPRAARIFSSVFGFLGAVLVVVSWLGADVRYWRAVVALAVLIGVLLLAVGIFLTGRGRFRLQAQPVRPVTPPRSDVPYRYTYWSQRAIDAITSDVRKRSRPMIKIIELGLPVFGLKVTLEQIEATAGRHAAATELERQFARYIHSDAGGLPDTCNALLTGEGTIHATAYGSGESSPPKGGRVTLFTSHESRGIRIAICLFGSMDNFDPSIQDMHPETVEGVPDSATPDVTAWIGENKEFPDQWNEPVGKAAYNIASPYREMPSSSANRARVAVMKQDQAEWFAHIYDAYRADPEKDLDLPFDLILVGRPIWVRAQYVAVSPGLGTTMPKFDQAYSEYWQRMLRLSADSDGWPVYLYRLLLRRQGVEADNDVAESA